MHVGILLPDLEDIDELQESARLIEGKGFSGIWKGHHVPVPGDPARAGMDPLSLLLLAGLATEHVEIGTCIYCVPLSNPGELAQRVYTLQSYLGRRFTFGVGTGSQALEYEEAGLSWDDRFTRLSSHMEYIRSFYETELGGRVEDMFERDDFEHAERERRADLQPSIPMRLGLPRLALGTWHSEPQLRRAVLDYDAWLASAGPGSRFGGWRKVLTEGMKIYRDLGGTRAILATTGVDLRMPEAPIDDMGRFDLGCGPISAAERLHMLEEIGFDDVILYFSDPEVWPRIRKRRLAAEDLEELRSLLPGDDRPIS